MTTATTTWVLTIAFFTPHGAFMRDTFTGFPTEAACFRAAARYSRPPAPSRFTLADWDVIYVCDRESRTELVQR